MSNKVGSRKNFGWGRKMGYAGAMALKRYLVKRPSSRSAHRSRWNKFCRYLETIGINDVKKINKKVIYAYGSHLSCLVENKEMKISYAVNIISTINVVMSLLRQDRTIKVSPKSVLGRRSRVRTRAPKGMKVKTIEQAMTDLLKDGYTFLSISIGVMRFFGLRRREVCLFDAVTALQQARESGQIRIIKGTKGGFGRKMERFVPVLSSKQLSILVQAADFQEMRKDLRPENTSVKEAINWFNYHWTKNRKRWGLGIFHDLRSCYACSRYQMITGVNAPIFTQGKRIADKKQDEKARAVISKEIGHLRIDIIAAYIGGR